MIIIWGGWLAFDAGTTLALNFRSVNAMCVTNICASAGAITWLGLTYYETGNFSLDSTFMGAIAGLVLITPSAGFIDMSTAFFFGVIGALVCRQALRFKFTKFAEKIRWVDNGDTFVSSGTSIECYVAPDRSADHASCVLLTSMIRGFAGDTVSGLLARK